MLKIVVVGEVLTRNGTYDGKPFVSHSQEAGLLTGGHFPMACRVRIDDPSQALEVGAEYHLLPSAFVSDENLRFSLRISSATIGEKVASSKPKAVNG